MIHNYRKIKSGFSLIEVVIYIALFSILLGSGFTMCYEILSNSDKLETKTQTQREINFVKKKIEWALTGISRNPSDLVSPSQTFPYPENNTLSLQKIYFGEKIPVKILFDAPNKRILMQTNNGALLPITTSNVEVTELYFTYLPAIGEGPWGIETKVTIDDISFTVVNYLRI